MAQPQVVCTSGPLSRRFSLHAANERKEFLLANRERKYSLSLHFSLEKFHNYFVCAFSCYSVGSAAVVVLFDGHRTTCRVECNVWRGVAVSRYDAQQVLTRVDPFGHERRDRFRCVVAAKKLKQSVSIVNLLFLFVFVYRCG